MDLTLGMIVLTCACYSIFHVKLAIKLNASIFFLDDTIKMSTKTTTKEKKTSRHLVSNVYDISVSCIRNLYDMDLLKLIFFYYSLKPSWMDFASQRGHMIQSFMDSRASIRQTQMYACCLDWLFSRFCDSSYHAQILCSSHALFIGFAFSWKIRA